MEKRKGFIPLESVTTINSRVLMGYSTSVKEKLKRDCFLKGFTLIELLVVIAIIVLLLAILFPSLQRARNSARAVVCQNNLKQWGTLLASHTEEFEDLGWQPNVWNSPYLITTYWKDLKDTLANSKIRFCPMAIRKGNRPVPPTFEVGKWLPGSSYKYPTDILLVGLGTLGSSFESWYLEWPNSPGGYSGSYGLNLFFDRSIFSGVNELNWGGFGISAKGQSNIPVFLDSALHYSIFIGEGQIPAPKEEEELSCCINRHDGSVNSLFLDWSVRKVGLKELWKLKWHKEFNTNGPWTTAGGVKPQDWPEWMREFKEY